MEIKEFIQNFADQFEDVDAASLTAETEFKTIDGWSSLVSLSIIAMVDEEYEVAIGGADIRQSKTIGDLFNVVKSKQK